jgi:hypothetical protein
MLRHKIPKVCFYFCSTERNSELISLQRNAPEQNSESLPLLLFHGTKFRAVSLPRNAQEQNFESLLQFLFNGTEFEHFSHPQNGVERISEGFPVSRNCRNSVGNNQMFCLFRLLRNNFISEIANPKG